jgi:hypothetical protein
MTDCVQVGIPGGNAQLALPLQDLVFSQKTMAGCVGPPSPRCLRTLPEASIGKPVCEPELIKIHSS